MMAFASLENIIPKILKNVNFEEYLLANKYSLLPNRNIKGFKCYSKKSDILGDDVVFVGNHKKEEVFYSLLFNDTGNVLDFVKNRIEFENDYETFEPSKDHLIEACKKLVLYINEKGENWEKANINTSEEDLQNLKKNTFTKYYNAEPIYDLKYLETFSLSPKIINHPIFKDRIFNSRGLIYNEQQLDIINTAFPLHNEFGKECGLYFENHVEKNNKIIDTIQFFAPGTVQTGLWLSNNYLVDKKFKTIVTVVNNPKEALAHFSHLKENRFYLSIFKKDETTFHHLKSVLNRQRSSLCLAGNVSLDSFVDEIKIIIEILDNKIEFIKENYDHVLIKVDKDEERFFEKLFKLIRKNNTLKVNQIVKTLGDDSKDLLKNDLIIPSQDIASNILIKIPKNFKTLYHFEQILIKTFPSQYDIKIEKPMYFNWTKQNINFKSAIEDTMNEEEVIQQYIEQEKIFVLTN